MAVTCLHHPRYFGRALTVGYLWTFRPGRVFAWVAIRAGWKMTAAVSVVSSERAISLPMLDVPAWWESQRLPNAMPVVQALKKMARVRLDCRKFVSPPRHATM